ncbi:MAG: Xanthine and dehydrogenase maturation factor XdhC/CoxF family-like protein [Streptosporangiaceae bacterium]|jgi:xanthine dehydrogenase accessory factor|nr:Xanthine and dehydrogenase maturation factor XdhC/CoxF family-like protein [Streptosporangiaceae bacterium]
MAHESPYDPACAVAHGEAQPDAEREGGRTLVAVFASPVADFLLRFGADLGYRGVLLEPDPGRLSGRDPGSAEIVTVTPDGVDGTADVVVTDHHRTELGAVLRDLLARSPRWIGVMGNPRHAGPHVRALSDLGVPNEDIARVHRPVGLNIGSRTPPEIAVATLAGLLADRNDRPGGFAF